MKVQDGKQSVTKSRVRGLSTHPGGVSFLQQGTSELLCRPQGGPQVSKWTFCCTLPANPSGVEDHLGEESNIQHNFCLVLQGLLSTKLFQIGEPGKDGSSKTEFVNAKGG